MAQLFEIQPKSRNLLQNKHMEIWKDIEGYEGRYQVSNLGNVKSLPKRKTGRFSIERIMVNCAISCGYYGVTLNGNGRVKTCKVHQLVAATFIPNPEGKKCINHINGIKTDNRVENLEWSTHIENMQHAMKTGLRGITIVLSEADVLELRRIKREGGKIHAERHRFNANYATLKNAANGKTWKHLPL